MADTLVLEGNRTSEDDMGLLGDNVKPLKEHKSL